MALDGRGLVTVATMEGVFGLSSGAADTQLERMIMAATRQMERIANRRFDRDDAIVEQQVGVGNNRLYVDRPPIRTGDSGITTIKLGDSTLNADDYEVEDDGEAGVIYFPEGVAWTARREAGAITSQPLPGSERQRYQITYKGGWMTPQQDLLDSPDSGVADLPEDLQQASIQLVSFYYRQEGADPSIRAKSVADASVTFGSGAEMVQGVPRSVYEVACSYSVSKFF